MEKYVIMHNISPCIPAFKPFEHLDHCWCISSRTSLENILKLGEKHSDKRRNCSERAISPIVTMFSTFSHRLSTQLQRFSIFWQSMFKVVCCRIVVWGKGLILSHLQQICSRRLQKHWGKNMENISKRKCNYWIEFKTLWQIVALRHNVFKSRLL